MGECKFDKSWVGRCKKPTIDESFVEGYCEEHSKVTCCQCGEQATHDCEETFQFVCGSPLCDKEECKIKHHPNNYRFLPSRWAKIYNTEIPEGLSGYVQTIDYKTFRQHLLKQPVRLITEAISEQMIDASTIDGIEKIYGFSDILVVKFTNGMSVRFKSDLE